MAYPGLEVRPLYFGLGLAAGLFAIVYNRTLLGTLAAADRLRGWPAELRAALIGAAVGMLAWFAPDLVGGGDAISQRTLLGVESLAIIPILFAVRLALGAVSYAAGAPGGLFAPMLVLGAQLGLFFGMVCQLALPDLNIQPQGSRRRRDGCLVHRRRARSAHRHRARYRNDSKRHDASADAGGMFHGHAGSDAATRCAHL